ncbi:phosphoribosylglycinamide formyltransferase [candidate division KSB1 bacterium]|nr:phosphoribosylglycinamide formyltransferase [candidate division KSB1 bacterium]NIR72152.1 phosphoribosylglycinamide formyltransferase [candidate division KSB1 bacterium]NIS26617.1 phosphoribosylglycinamide formyltransferase [candidate division KSB1 bacterium]NIT73385.1 phosphoribosylglycinamide formyltransferase [candidate division KSB1 bacterium]NIU27233.1 phosphoribosylglycinamide formyltransferase [candidate division KSB1 bacterium]
MIRVAVFASGGGSNLNALLEAVQSGRLDASIVLVISNKAEAGALQIAREYGVPAVHISQKSLPSDDEFNKAILTALKEHGVDMIALAGYLKKIDSCIIREYKNRILNIHPALLPSFGGKGMYGLKVHQAVLDYGCKVAGVTVHLVDEEYDTGPPILQRCVPVEPDDTPETLAARVLEQEHKIYAEALQLFAENRVKIQGRKVSIK